MLITLCQIPFISNSSIKLTIIIMFTLEEKQQLLTLARDSINHYLKTGKTLNVEKGNLPLAFMENRACFVTLTIDKQLRGCIGHLLPIQPLYLDVIENAVSAAFKDPRFEPLSHEEFDSIKIEISVLSVPQKLEYKGADDLIKKLNPGKDGVIIQKGFYSSTFLPQVWEQIKNPEDFLSHLCAKAGLNPYEWKKGDLRVETYTVECFEEGD